MTAARTTAYGRARPRDLVAAITLIGPAAVIVGSWVLWHTELPVELPRQWNSSGVSTTWPTWLALSLLGAVAFCAAVVGAFALREEAADRRRKTFLWSGFAAGMTSGAWLMVAGSTITSNVASEPEIGAWPVALMLSMGYGLLPFLIAHRWINPDDQHRY